MLIKAITDTFRLSGNVEYARLFDDVENLEISDYWNVSGAIGDNDPVDRVGATTIAIQPPCMPNSEHTQQQYVVLDFTSHGKDFRLISTQAVYVMNDSGKTIQALHPTLENIPTPPKSPSLNR